MRIRRIPFSVEILIAAFFLTSCKGAALFQSADAQPESVYYNIPEEISDKKLMPPEDLRVVNHKTGTQKYLTLKWSAVSGAKAYRIYYAVYPTYQYRSGKLPLKNYELLVELPADPNKNFMVWNHHIPAVPLRRYSYCVASVNDWETSEFSPAVDGWRFPTDEKEALLDIDYNIHFAQTAIPDFGKQGRESIVSGRASGNYYYASKMTKVMSKFENYADFETILNGDPTIKINFFPLGVRMNGDINVSGLYKAVVTYNDLICVPGGYTRKGKIKITYHHPEKGILQKEYDYDQIRSMLKTVAYNADEVRPRPPAAEWDESAPEYMQRMRKIAKLPAEAS